MQKIAIIGAGAIALYHLEGYLKFPDRCQIVAISDIYPEKAQALASKFNLDVSIIADYKELLNGDIDLVSVCTPPYTHASISVDFLKAGTNVIVEKPMASSLEECDEMIAAQQESGKLLSVIAQNRFRDPMMKLKSVLESGLAGKISHVQVDSYWWRGHCYYDLWWRGTWEKEGGGCTLNHAVHHIDALLWMNGMPTHLKSYASNTAHDNAEVEDLSIAIMRYNDGGLAQVTSSVVHHGQEQQLIFQGLDARVSSPWQLTASSSKANGFPEPNEELEAKIQAYYDALPSLEYEGHAGQIDNVLTALETGSQILIDGISGRATLELITGIYKASTSGSEVTFPLSKDDPFYTREGILKNTTYFYEKKNSVENFSSSSITT